MATEFKYTRQPASLSRGGRSLHTLSRKQSKNLETAEPFFTVSLPVLLSSLSPELRVNVEWRHVNVIKFQD